MTLLLFPWQIQGSMFDLLGGNAEYLIENEFYAGHDGFGR